MINKFLNIIPILFIVFLVCNLTPANAVTLGEMQDNANNLKNNLNPYKLNKKVLLSQLKLFKTQLSSLSSETQEQILALEAENKQIKEKQQNLVSYRNSEVKDGSNSYANNAADHIVSELQAKHFLANKALIPLEQLKNNTIVQVINEKGYISYIIYDGLVQTEDGKTIVLIKNIPIQSERYMTLEKFQKNYTGITIAISESKASMDMAQEIWEIQKKDLEAKLAPLKVARDSAQNWLYLLYFVDTLIALSVAAAAILTILLIALGMNPITFWASILSMPYITLIGLIVATLGAAAVYSTNTKRQEIHAINTQIKSIEDEMKYLGVLGA